MAEPTISLVKKPRAKRKMKQLSLDYGLLTDDQLSFIRASHKSKKLIDDAWRGMGAVPPGSLFERVLQQFKRNTNIPLEIPFTTLLHYISGYLCSKDVTLRVHDQSVKMDFWTIVLADSGAGKTWTKNQIGKALGGTVPELSGSFASAAKFVDELAATPKGILIRDEFLQLLKAIEQPAGPLADLKDYLLRLYDNDEIGRKTKQYEIKVTDPAISILAFNVLSSFTNGMSPESLLDGFSQRFSYVIARKDPKRFFGDYAIWSVDSAPWRVEWDALVSNILPDYEATAGAEKSFERSFKGMIECEIDESFYRRVLWRAHKYALIYHIIRGKAANKFVDEEDYAWAARLITLQLSDAGDVLQMCGGSDISKLIEQCEKSADRLLAAGKTVTLRVLMQNVRGLTSAGLARFVVEMMDKRYVIS